MEWTKVLRIAGNFWFWCNKIQRNKKANNRSRQRLYHRMFVGLWLHQKSLQTNSSFEQTKRIRSWSKSNSANRIGINHIYKNELDKPYFVNDAAYSDSKDLAKRTISDKIFKERAYKIVLNPKHDGHQRELACMVYKFSEKKTGSGASVNEEVAQTLHKPVIKKFKKGKPMSGLKIIFGLQIEMRPLSSKNEGVKYLLRVIDVFTKYAWVKPLKIKKAKTVHHGFIEITIESKDKQIKLWVDQGKFYSNFMQKQLEDNDILM